jgi:biopolymer transport protein ExbD
MNLKRRRKFNGVPLSSTSDLAFLLLIFIMLVSLINYRVEVNIDYAEAHTARRVSEDKNLEIWVDRLGQVYLEGSPSSLAAIEYGIIEMYNTAPDTRVHVIADRNTSFRDVQQVLSILQRLQYRTVSFVVKND